MSVKIYAVSKHDCGGVGRVGVGSMYRGHGIEREECLSPSLHLPQKCGRCSERLSQDQQQHAVGNDNQLNKGKHIASETHKKTCENKQEDDVVS